MSSGDSAVARAFAAAADYDSHARIQRLAARELARRIAGLELPPRPRLLEIGCGTGFLGAALREHGVAGDWLVTDLAPAMVERARARLGPSAHYAVLDGEHGTPPGGPFDLICASLATQWFADEPAALGHWREWLAPGGHVMAATLGPGTFAEWREAHAAEGLHAGTPDFTPPAAFEALALAEPLTVERYRERHDDARAFLAALRAIGAQTASPAHRPLSPGALRRVMRRFEAGGAIVSYEVVTCHLARANEPA
jgi:malonyl-CoA O-methyltransferase